MSKIRLASASFGLLVSFGVAAGAQSNPKVYTPDPEATQNSYPNDAPQVDVWLDEYSYRYGDIIRPKFAAENGAFVTILRVTSDGELRVLYPVRPNDQRRYREGQLANDRIPITDQSFYLKESSGTGFIFAIASFNRFDYGYYSTGNFWSTARLANAGRFGNPYEIVRSFAEETVGGDGEYSIDYEMYNVDGRSNRSRYARRYAGYSYNDYLESCYDTFGISYYYYCRSANIYGGPIIIVNNPAPQNPRGEKRMNPKRLIPDPMLPHVPLQPQPAEGRMPVQSEPASPRIYRRAPDPMTSHPSPRNDAPRAEPRRADPPPQAPARVEVRNEPQRVAPPPPPRSEPAQKRQKDN